MWKRVVISMMTWLLFKPYPEGIDLKTIQSVLSCPNIIIDRIEQKGYSYTLLLKGSGVEQCLQNKMSYCRAEKGAYFCRIMDHRRIYDNKPGYTEEVL